MKALILNSGIGKRMGDLTAVTCKCLVEIAEDVTILDIQLSLLADAGINDICITTGSFAKRLEDYVTKRYPDMRFCFVHNPVYEETNYIYSIYLAREILQGDILLLHGDLVFEQSVLEDALSAPTSVLITDTTKPLPIKDFKAVILNEKVRRVGVDEFGKEACYTQPMYKLLKTDWLVWLEEINRFCLNGNTCVYAENALNIVSQDMNLLPLDVKGRICFEIDNEEDLAYGKRVYEQFLKPKQTIYEGYGSLSKVESIIHDIEAKKIFVVGDPGLDYHRSLLPPNTVYFSDFTSNPDYDEVIKGITLYENEKCDFIISIGGGSAIDVAKCINILDINDGSRLEKARCKHLAIPTTAGTGSESTCFAVIYKDDVKSSIEHQDILPEFVILDPTLLSTLPLYHKKSTLLDALCQGIESMWAKGATVESKNYARKAIALILDNVDSYIEPSTSNSTSSNSSENAKLESAKHILKAANLSGKAINISKTTAAHAMSYKLSTKFDIAHGQAVAICLPHVWRHLLDEGEELAQVSEAMGAISANEALEMFILLLDKLEMNLTIVGDDADLLELVSSVNPERLSNHPVIMAEEILTAIYGKLISHRCIFRTKSPACTENQTHCNGWTNPYGNYFK